LGLPSGDAASRQALSGMLENVTIDGSWVLTEAQLAKLINRVGGVTVDVDTDVVRRTGGGGGQILVAAGQARQLDGTQAVEYATYRASAHEDAAAQLARLQQVVDGMIVKLPTGAALSADLRVLGPGGSSTLGATKLASLLAGIKSADQVAGHVLPIDLPTAPIDTGGAPSYRIDNDNAAKLANNNLKSSLPDDAGQHRPTVELLNGVGTPGLIARACPRLQAHRLVYAGSGNAAFTNQPSVVEVSNSQIDLGYTVASALGLPRSAVRRTSQNQSVADVIVILGRDFK
ncbi:MAG: LytR C-terminal domain-containing protein, partial [Frankiaceae bacterium]|nr:LytR C-terminal domain-containing protein [Frankiaceae bacterium]